MAVALAPLLFTSITAPWFPKVFCSDASGAGEQGRGGQGVVVSDFAADVTGELARMPLSFEPRGAGHQSWPPAWSGEGRTVEYDCFVPFRAC